MNESALEAYIIGEPCHDDPFDDRESWNWFRLVAAEGAEAALASVCVIVDPVRVTSILAGTDDYLKVTRFDFADDHIKADGTIELSRDQWREAGWGQADEDACHCCGLYANGMAEYRVCGECGHCPECRDSDDDCPSCRP